MEQTTQTQTPPTTTTTTTTTTTKPLSYYQLNRQRILARYAEKRADLIAYQLAYYAENREELVIKQTEYNANYYRQHREQILLNKSQKVCCLCCKRIVSERQMTKHRTTAICKSSQV